MKNPFSKRQAWHIILICVLLFTGSVKTAYADVYDYASDENLAVYVNNPDFRFENGLAINIKTNAVENYLTSIVNGQQKLNKSIKLIN